MANKISTNAAACFIAGKTFNQSNTCVNDNAMYLWGNKIIWKDDKGVVCFSLCGWDTHTTCERLRACGLPIYHKRGVLCYDNLEIDDCAKYMIVGGVEQIKRL